LLILQNDVNSSNGDVISDSKVAPASFTTVAGESPATSDGQPLIFSPTTDNAAGSESPLEPIVDSQMSKSTGDTASQFNPGVYVPNQPGIVAANPEYSQGQPSSPPVIQPGMVYGQPGQPNCVRNYQPAQATVQVPSQAPRNVTYRYQSAPVQVARPAVAPYRVPTVVQQPVTTNQQPVVVQQRYRAYQAQPVQSNQQYVVQGPSTTRVQQTGPNTYRVTTTTERTRYVPVQVQVQQRTPVYQPGMTVRPVERQVVPVGPQSYVPGRPLRNAIIGAFR